MRSDDRTTKNNSQVRDPDKAILRRKTQTMVNQVIKGSSRVMEDRAKVKLEHTPAKVRAEQAEEGYRTPTGEESRLPHARLPSQDARKGRWKTD